MIIRCMSNSSSITLALKTHVVSTTGLLVELEHVRAQSKLAQQAIAEVLQLPQHLILLLLLLYRDTLWKPSKCAPDFRKLRGGR